MLGRRSIEKGDLDGALAAFRNAVEVSREDARPWYWLAQAYLTAGDRTGYRKTCAELLRRFGKTRDPAAAGRVLYTCPAVPDAPDNMAQPIPSRELAATNQANARVPGAALYRAGKYQAAVEPLKQGRSRAWDRLFLAIAHHRLGQTAKARAYLKRAGEQLRLALKDGLIWNTLGVAQCRAGDWKAALPALEKPMALPCGQMESANTFFLAMAHWQAGNRAEAHQWYHRAMRWMGKNQPNHEELRGFRAEATMPLKVAEAPKPPPKSK